MRDIKQESYEEKVLNLILGFTSAGIHIAIINTKIVT